MMMLGVHAAAIVLSDGGDRLVVHPDQGAVDDPHPGLAGRIGLQRLGQHGDQVMNDAVKVDWLVPNRAAIARW
jgi:hypothetical protein